MRRSSAQGAELDSSVCNSSFRESRTNSPGHFNSSRLMKVPPSRDLIFFWTRLVDKSSEACWNVSQLFEFLVGTVLGGLCKLASPAVRMGTQEYVPLWVGNPKSKSLFHLNLLHIISGADDCSGVEDNGLRGVLMGVKAHETFVLDQNEGFAPSLIEGPIACGHRAYPVYEAASLLRSQSLFCTRTQGGGSGIYGRGVRQSGRHKQWGEFSIAFHRRYREWFT